MAEKDTQTPVISLRGLKKWYGIGDAQHHALNAVDLEVQNGEFIAIMGPSGCGKTTLLNILGLLDHPNDGEYHLDGEDVARLGGRKRAHLRSSQIGIVFQNFNLIERMNIIENVALPLTYRGIGHTKRLEMASEVLKNFHLQEREYYMPWQLSGGQLQRVAIARALVNSPSLILADEPTGNLDSKSSHVIMQELADLHKRGNTIIMVTHNPSLTSYASRVIHMLDGEIASDSKERGDESVAIPVTTKQQAVAAQVEDADAQTDIYGIVDDIPDGEPAETPPVVAPRKRPSAKRKKRGKK